MTTDTLIYMHRSFEVLIFIVQYTFLTLKGNRVVSKFVSIAPKQFFYSVHNYNKHQSLLARMETCVATEDILGTHPHIGMGYTGISLIQTNNIIYEAS